MPQAKNSIIRTIENIKDIIRDENCLRMNKSNIKGYLGELFVKKKLEDEGLVVVHKGNQSGYDLELSGGIKIDVKASTIKGSKRFPDWAWALRIKSLDKVKFTHLICVALDQNYDVSKYCIIKVEDLEMFPSASGRFNSVKRSFSLMLDGINYPAIEYFQKCERLINDGKVKVINSNDILSYQLNSIS